MTKLVGINEFYGINLELFPFVEYRIMRGNNDKSETGRLISDELIPRVNELRRKMPYDMSNEFLYQVAYLMDPDLEGKHLSEENERLMRLIEGFDVDDALIRGIVNCSKRLGRDVFHGFINPLEFPEENVSILVSGGVPAALILPRLGPFTYVSGNHAKMTPYPDGVMVEDMGSSHGTAVDGIVIGVNKTVDELEDRFLREGRHNISRDELRGKVEAPYGSTISLAPIPLGDPYSFRVERSGFVI
ncbi:MAG: FHA domain-containing protein [Candidatus Aenigmatarchaeota archaeon]|nr:MAG: FHA domain-containing protein [Candidatus Aenigmarchaeota archaeon]